MNSHNNKYLKIWWQAPDALRFLIVGGWNTAFGMAGFAILFLLLHTHIHYLIIYVINAEIAILQAFYSLRKLVFNSVNPVIRELLKHHAGCSISIALPFFLFWICVERFKLNPIIAQIPSTFIGVLASYLIARFFVFRAVAPKGPHHT